MRAPLLLAADFLKAFQALMPVGPVWPRDPDAVQTRALSGLMPTYERQAARANNLLVDSFPATTTELLPEWEETLGLPDPCAGPQPTIQQRRAQVVARFTAGGGQSPAFFVQYALTLGYSVTIQQFAPSTFGRPFGLPMGGAAWAHTWQVTIPGSLVDHRFEFGADAFGEPFAVFGFTVLQCELNRLKPAQTILLFAGTPGVIEALELGAAAVTEAGAEIPVG